MIKQILLAFQFLTIIPVRITGTITDRNLADSSVFFPLAGLFQGIVASICGYLLREVFSPDVSAALLLAVFSLITGGFHLDGLSDTFDGIAVKSSGNTEGDHDKRLSVMKDSTSGAIGTVAVVMVLLLHYVLIRDILMTKGPFSPLFVIILLPVLTKWAMVVGMTGAKSARPDGLGKIFVENTGIRQAILSTCITLTLVTGCFFVYSRPTAVSLSSFIVFIVVVLIFLFAIVYTLRHLFTCRFGGLTGDTLGAIHEIAGLSFLLIVLLWR